MTNRNIITYKGCQVIVLGALNGNVNAPLGIRFDIQFRDGKYLRYRGMPNRFDSQSEAVCKAKHIIDGDIKYH